MGKYQNITMGVVPDATWKVESFSDLCKLVTELDNMALPTRKIVTDVGTNMFSGCGKLSGAKYYAGGILELIFKGDL